MVEYRRERDRESTEREVHKMINYLKRTALNKIVAAAFVFVGYLSTLPENDITVFVFTLFIAVCLFFANDNVIEF